MKREDYADDLDFMKALGIKILEEIDTTKATASRQYYSACSIILDVAQLEDKLGKSKERDIGDALSKYGNAKKMTLATPNDTMRDLRALFHKVERRHAALQAGKPMSAGQPFDASLLKDILDLLTKLAALVAAIYTGYKAVKTASDRPAKRKHAKK